MKNTAEMEKKEEGLITQSSSSEKLPMSTSVERPSSLLRGGSLNDQASKEQMEKLYKENKALKNKLDQIETENKKLKKSLYELTSRYSYISQQLGKSFLPMVFNLDSVLETDDNVTSSLFMTSDNRKFDCKYNLTGHSSAVFVVEFSPCGKFLASGSFDKSCKIYDVSTQKELWTLQAHTSTVVDVCWSPDSQELITASYDSSVKLCDVTKYRILSSFLVGGFVQSVKFNPSDVNTFFAASTHNKIVLFDKREPERIGLAFENSSMVNSIAVRKDGIALYSGDGFGEIKIWDCRKPGSAPILSFMIDSDESRVPISNITLSTEEDGHYLGVNAYDNALRVLEVNSRPPSLHQTHKFSDHRNKNWPIRNSFFRGKAYQPSSLIQEDQQEEDFEERSAKVSIEGSFLIATGSAEPYAYIFDIGNPKGGLLQKLRGHQNRVYSASFHPFNPILATSSADSTIKLWSCGRF